MGTTTTNIDISGFGILTQRVEYGLTKLVTTEKTEIISNKMLLPSMPEGDLLFNMMFVYNENDVADIYNCHVTLTDTEVFAEILADEDEIVAGFGIVSYLTKIAE